MPVHDWTRIDAGIFHAFHLNWLGRLQDALNDGIMPPNYYALAEQHAGRMIPDLLTLNTTAPPAPRDDIHLCRTIAIRHISGHRLIAVLEVISPANKDRKLSVENFATKVVTALENGVHVAFVDLFPPGRHDPHSLHHEFLCQLEEANEAYELPDDEPLTLASYAAGEVINMYIDHLAVEASLPDMPLYFLPDRYVSVPLEMTYQQAYHSMPAFWRQGA